MIERFPILAPITIATIGTLAAIAIGMLIGMG